MLLVTLYLYCHLFFEVFFDGFLIDFIELGGILHVQHYCVLLIQVVVGVDAHYC